MYLNGWNSSSQVIKANLDKVCNIYVIEYDSIDVSAKMRSADLKKLKIEYEITFDWIMVFLQVIAHLLCAHCKDFQDFSANTGLPITKIIDSFFIGYEIAKKLPVF